MKTVRVIEPAIPRLGDEWQAPPISAGVRRAVFDSPCDYRIARDTDAVGIGNDNWAFKKSAFFNPMRAGHFTVAVQAEHAGVDRIVQRIVSARDDGRDAGPDWTFADHKFSFATNDGRVTNFDAGDVGDRVQRTRRSFKWDTEIARANNLLRRCRSCWRRLLRLARERIERQ